MALRGAAPSPEALPVLTALRGCLPGINVGPVVAGGDWGSKATV